MEAYMLQSVPATTGQTALLHVKCDLGSKTVQQLRISCVTCSVRIIVRTPSHRPSSVQVHARLQLQDLTNTASHLHTARPIPAIVPPPHTGLPTFYLCTYRVPTNTLQTCSQNSTNRGPVDPHGRSLHGPREPPSLTSPLKTRSTSSATSPTTPLTMAEGSLNPSQRTQWRSSACPTPTLCRSPR